MKLTWTNQGSLPCVTVPTNDEKQSCVFGSIKTKQTRKIVCRQKLYLFASDQPVAGTIEINLPDNGKKVDHTGIKAELIGQIGMFCFKCDLIF